MVKEIFKLKNPNFNKLEKYGFKILDRIHRLEIPILNGQFHLFVFITDDGEISTKVIDTETEDEYVLHLMQDAIGEFVGKVRTELKEF